MEEIKQIMKQNEIMKKEY